MNALQIRVLRVLAAARGPMDRKLLAERTTVNPGSKESAIGPVVGRVSGKNEALESEYGPNLITLGLIRDVDIDVEGTLTKCYAITAAGRQALKQIV